MAASAFEIFLVLCLYLTATFLPRSLPQRYYPSYKLIHDSLQILVLVNILLIMGVFSSMGLSLAFHNQLRCSAKNALYVTLSFYVGWMLGYADGTGFFDDYFEKAFALLKSLEREISPETRMDGREARRSQ